MVKVVKVVVVEVEVVEAANLMLNISSVVDGDRL
jgi:hypothetical protein